MWSSSSLLSLGQKGKNNQKPKSLNICWSLDFSLHPSLPQQLFSSCKIKAEASSSSLALECHPLCCYYPDFSGQRPLVLYCSLKTLLLWALAWQLHWIWAHRVIYWVCWYSAMWFRREKREREKRGMHQKSNICIIINNNNKDKCQPQVTLVALATPFNILTVACGPCMALDSVWCLQRG